MSQRGITSETVAIDLDRARRETPGCAHVAHLNNAGAALPPTAVTDAVVDHLRLEARIGGYEAAAAAKDASERAYAAIATLIGAEASEIALVENATRAWDMAFYSIPFLAGDRILTAQAEYGSNVLAFLQVAKRTGARVEIVDNDEHGQFSIDDLRRRLADDVRLIAVTHVPTQGGLVNPAAEIGAVARAAGVPFLLDACQSVGQLRIDVAEIGCDMLSGTGRKYLRGPRGTGFLYVSSRFVEQLDPPFIDMQAATWTAPDEYVLRRGARRFETWESNVAGHIGLGAAVEYALAWDIDDIEERVTRLAERLRAMLAERPGVRLHDQGARKCGIVTFTVDGVPAEEIQQKLAAAGVNTSVSLVSHALNDLTRRGLGDLVRASVHYYNTDEELALLCDHLPAPR